MPERRGLVCLGVLVLARKDEAFVRHGLQAWKRWVTLHLKSLLF